MKACDTDTLFSLYQNQPEFLFFSDYSHIMHSLCEGVSSTLRAGLFSLLDWEKSSRIRTDDLFFLLLELQTLLQPKEDGYTALWRWLQRLETDHGFPLLSLQLFIQLQCKLLAAILPGVCECTGRDLQALLRSITASFTTHTASFLHPPASADLFAFNALSYSEVFVQEEVVRDPELMLSAFKGWLDEGNLVIDSAVLSSQDVFAQRRESLCAYLGVAGLTSRDVVACVRECFGGNCFGDGSDCDCDCDHGEDDDHDSTLNNSLIPLHQLIQFWDRFFPLSPLSSWVQQRITLLSDLFSVFSVRVTQPDGTQSERVSIHTIAAFICCLLDDDIMSLLLHVLRLHGHSTALSTQEVIRTLRFLASCVIFIEQAMRFLLIRRSGVSFFSTTEFDSFFASVLLDMGFDASSSYLPTDVFHIVLHAPSLFLSSSTYLQHCLPTVRRSLFSQIEALLLKNEPSLRACYPALKRVADNGVVFRGDYYRAMCSDFRGSVPEKLLFMTVVDGVWDRCMAGRGVTEGCEPETLLKAIASLLYTDAVFFAQYADVIHPSEDDMWSFNEVYSFFFSIYQIYNDVAFVRSLYF